MKQATKLDNTIPLRPAKSPEVREMQLMALATDLAEQQLRDGTASSQVICHYLKLASTKDQLEKQIMELQKELIAAKTENLKSTRRMEELYADAVAAMKDYTGDKDE